MKQAMILVPTDLSDTAHHASVQAAELSMRFDTALHFIHVRETNERGCASLAEFMDALRSGGEPSLIAKLGVLRGNDVEVTFEGITADTVLDGIVDAVDRLQPGLVVVGTHGRTGIHRLVMGSVAEKILRHVQVNVLSLSPRAPLVRALKAFERIVVPVDFSDPSKRALEFASSLLLPHGELTVCHIVSSPVHPSFYAAGVSQLFDVDPGLAKRIEARLEEWVGDREISARIVREGDIHAELQRVVSEADAQVVVMGTRGLSGLDHFLLGSVTEKMVRLTEIPVLSVH